MITINLLPKEIQKEKDLSSLKWMASTVLIALLVLLFLLWMFAGIHLQARKVRLGGLERKWTELRPQVEKVNKLEERRKTLQIRVALVDNLLQNRLIWARKLSDISRLLPDGVWLNNLRVEKQGEPSVKTLIINGTAVSMKGQEVLDLIGMFMARLESDEDFFADFVSLKPGSSSRDNKGTVSAMNFELVLRFAEGR